MIYGGNMEFDEFEDMIRASDSLGFKYGDKVQASDNSDFEYSREGIYITDISDLKCGDETFVVLDSNDGIETWCYVRPLEKTIRINNKEYTISEANKLILELKKGIENIK